MLEYYQNYLTNIATSPDTSYKNMAQAFNNDQWINTTQKYDVLEQSQIGSELYNPINVQIDYALEMGTGLKKSDDYKLFNFESLVHDVEYGLLYQYDGMTWITVNKSEVASIFQSIEVRKCNNIAKWIDPYSGIILEQPCVIEYDIGSSRPKQSKDIIVADNSMVLIIQGNEYTKKLSQNQRFIFNGRPFKLSGFNTSLQNDIVTNATTLYYYDLYLDTEKPTDDMINGIADRFEYNYQINILENPIENIKGFSGKLNAQVTLNNAVVDRNVVWSSNANGIIDNNGNYSLLGNVGVIAEFTATFGEFSDTISIKIVDNIIDNFEIIISPEITEIKQNRTLKVEANLYKNGVKQTDIVISTASGADNNKCYSWTKIGNNLFELTNNTKSIKPLVIKFTSGTINKIISIELNAIY